MLLTGTTRRSASVPGEWRFAEQADARAVKFVTGTAGRTPAAGHDAMDYDRGPDGGGTLGRLAPAVAKNEAGRIAAEDLRFGQRARADPTQGPEIVVIEGRRGDSDQHLFPAGNGIGDLGDLEVAERVVTAVSDRTNCQHGRQR